MILQIFSIRDRAVDAFDRPMFTVARGQMMRSFQDEVNRADVNNQVYLHPADYELWYLGEFETSSGEFSPVRPEMCCVAKDLVIKKE